MTGKMKLDPRPVEVGPVLEAAVGTIRPAAAAKNTEVRCTVGPVEIIVADRDRLQQVFWNLLSNAVKFTPPGGRVQVRLQRVGRHVEVRVTDTGIGIAPELLPRMFQRFQQADQSSTRVHTGLGLGLALARSLVEAHGGELSAHSAGVGQGSTFVARFPVPAIVEPPAMASPPDVQLTGIYVLLVDDEPDARQSIGAVLRTLGADVVCAASVAEAMVVLERGHPQVLLADIAMPDQDGYELIRKVRASRVTHVRTVPAAALTAYSGTEHRLRALSAGYQLHLAKPLHPNELAAAVSNLAAPRNGAP